MKPNAKHTKKVSLFNKFLNGVEKAGNKLPHPITLFAIFTLAVVLVSAICSALGISATGELIDRKTNEIQQQTITVVNLLSREGIAYMLKSAVTNFSNFAPLGMVLVTMLGVGCAEGSGYLSALMKKAVSITPAVIVTPMLVFLGVMSNMASDVGYVVLIPIGAVVFMAYGRHPMAGIAAAFCGVSGGFSANLLIGTIDPMLAGLSTEASHLVDPNYTVLATDNWFFMMASTFLIVILGTIITDKIVEPRFSKNYTNDMSHDITHQLTKQESKALKYANLSLLAIVLLFVVLAFPQNSFLRNPETGSLMKESPLIDGLIPIVAIIFFIPSVVYGRISGKYKNEKDVCNQLQDNMSSMGGYIALSFVAAQFVSYFNYTNLGTILAIKGANAINELGVSGPVLMVLFILFAGFINLFMGSASAKWAILAPVFVPMFMLAGYAPELTQVAYRIGDSCTNLITPLMHYFAMIVVFTRKYDKNSGIGTIISTMLPYSIIFMICWSALLVIWMLLGIPLGPGASIML